MANVRAAIKLTEEEQCQFFETAKTVIMATNNHDGYPHLVPMWFSMIDGLVSMHTYKTSQKVLNIQRDPRGAVLIEDGVQYDKLRGVFIRGRFELIDDQELCYRIAVASAKKYNELDEETAGPALRHYIRKRVALIFHPEKVSSWDHGKIGSAG
ncbi:MAG TPA: pyridoxamine 5'-phosphate oxidase family protein [Candidatus Binatia bacterium]|nr:pyridoxamine 5'-phosphate oxidase family protein [Candidatus Binatia bacterium]